MSRKLYEVGVAFSNELHTGGMTPMLCTKGHKAARCRVYTEQNLRRVCQINIEFCAVAAQTMSLVGGPAKSTLQSIDFGGPLRWHGEHGATTW